MDRIALGNGVWKNPDNSLTVDLHPEQKKFLDHPAIVRAFCSGIGGGKSHVGSYDMIRKAKPGRLYCVLAPTYQMLQDASWRSFTDLARSLGLLKHANKGKPPSVELNTGAEILFRSADDPQRLRGPNLSGIWMDEASEIYEDAFHIAIGRLRQGGQQGWLTATFTPKGKAHWTFSVFGLPTNCGEKNNADTAFFHCQTKDNPFLPKDFHENTAKRYTSFLAAQELEGRFMDAQGLMFQRSWFKKSVQRLPDGEYVKVRAWDKAASEMEGDFSAGVLMAYDRIRGLFYVMDCKKGQWSWEMRNQIMLATAIADGQEVEVEVEQEPGSGGKESAEFTVKQLAGFNVHAKKPTGAKDVRAQPFAAQAEAGNIVLLEGPWTLDWLDEICSFPQGKHDDACLVAGTPVMTAQGYKPIEGIVAGDLVLTRKGHKLVTRSWMTGIADRVYRITISDGREITGTGNHLVLCNNSWTRIDETKAGDKLAVWKNHESSCVSSMGGLTADTQIRRGEITEFTSSLMRKIKSLRSTFTERFGSSISDKYQKATTSTTRMKTRLTTILATLSASQKRYTEENTPRVRQQSVPTLIGLGTLLPSGTLPKKDSDGIANTPRGSPRQDRTKNLFASIAESSTWLGEQEPIGSARMNAAARQESGETVQKSTRFAIGAKRTSQRDVSELPIVRVDALCFTTPVYDLTVQGEHEFFANGILVHNCDASAAAFSNLALKCHAWEFRGSDPRESLMAKAPKEIMEFPDSGWQGAKF